MTQTALVISNASPNTQDSILRLLEELNPEGFQVVSEEEAAGFPTVIVVGEGGPAKAFRLEDHFAAAFPESAVAGLIAGLAAGRQVSSWPVIDLPKGGDPMGTFKQTPTGQWAVLEGPNPADIRQTRVGREIEIVIPLSGEWRLVPTWVTHG